MKEHSLSIKCIKIPLPFFAAYLNSIILLSVIVKVNHSKYLLSLRTSIFQQLLWVHCYKYLLQWIQLNDHSSSPTEFHTMFQKQIIGSYFLYFQVLFICQITILMNLLSSNKQNNLYEVKKFVKTYSVISLPWELPLYNRQWIQNHLFSQI